jgi:hypothetical protein
MSLWVGGGCRCSGSCGVRAYVCFGMLMRKLSNPNWIAVEYFAPELGLGDSAFGSLG